MYVVTVDFSVHKEHLNAFMPAMLDNARQSLALESGCRQFDVCVAPDDATQVFLYERYDSAEDFGLHLKASHFLQFDTLVAPMVATKKVRVLTQLKQEGGGPP